MGSAHTRHQINDAGRNSASKCLAVLPFSVREFVHLNRMVRLRVSKIALVLGAPFLIPLASPLAHAGAAFYVDAGGAVSEIRQPEPFYGSGAQSPGVGYGLDFGMFTTFTERSPAINLQFGVLDRYSSGTASATSSSYQLMAAYPVLRLQITRLFFSGGYTPYVWRGETLNGSSSSLSLVTGARAAYGEAGLLAPITPKFSFGFSASSEWITDNHSSSPGPVLAGNIYLRFHFGIGTGEEHESSEFKGWRYPFGRDL